MEHWVTVKNLKEVLKDMDNDLKLYPNAVGNLSVIDKEVQYIGYINLLPDFCEYETFNNETD